MHCVYTRAALQWDGFKRFWRFRIAALTKYVALVPILFSLAVAYLLIGVGQMQEIYMRILESKDYVRFLLGAVLCILLGYLLMFSYISLTKHGTVSVRGSGEDIYLARRALWWRDVVAVTVGATPTLGLLAGTIAMHWSLMHRTGTYLTATRDIEARLRAAACASCEPGIDLTRSPRGLPSLADIDAATSSIHGGLPVMAIVAALAVLVYFLLWGRQRLHSIRRVCWLLAVAILVITLVVFPLLPSEQLVELARMPGPLALVLMQFITLLAIVMSLVHLSRLVGLPIILLLCLAIAGFALSASTISDTASYLGKITAALTSADKGTIGGQATVAQSAPPPRLRESYENWLRGHHSSIAAFERERRLGFRAWARGSRRGVKDLLVRGTSPTMHEAIVLARRQRYPVYIVAAQGGGVYAASAASTFLGHLHDRFPFFDRHLFAVSGVSGGSVGAAAYAAFDVTAGAGRSCPDRTSKVRRVFEQDHLSPVLALVVAEYAEKALLGASARNARWLLRKMLGLTEIEITTRASALQKSLEIDARGADNCSQQGEKGRLADPFGSGWTSSGSALVLNTTLAETGERIAFAPFRLHDIGQGSLSSWQDDHVSPLFPAQPRPITLAEAAVASARFPGLMPAMPRRTSKGGWINLVDGGYADNSGVATASAIYDVMVKLQSQTDDPALKALLAKVEPRIIVLTGSERADMDLSEKRGTVLADLVAPVLAMLSVRSRISTREVFLAQDRHRADGGAQASRRVRLVQLDDNFSLQLGWTFSKSTSDIISLMVARPEFCAPDGPAQMPSGSADDEEQRRKRIDAALLMSRNACVVREMLREMMGR